MPGIEGQPSNDGMTLRDYFAAKAMQSLLSHYGAYEDDESAPNSFGSEDAMNVDLCAKYAYVQADAMMEARK